MSSSGERITNKMMPTARQSKTTKTHIRMYMVFAGIVFELPRMACDIFLITFQGKTLLEAWG